MLVARLHPFVWFPFTIPLQHYPYRVTDLGALPGPRSSVARGNWPDGTEIVGWCTDRGVLREEGKGIRELPPPPGYSSACRFDVHDAGLICTRAEPPIGMVDVTPSPTDHHAFGWNNSGQVIGYGGYGAWRFTPGTGSEYLGLPTGFGFTAVFAITDAGQVCPSASLHPRYSSIDPLAPDGMFAMSNAVQLQLQ